jgi:hypothetical protein
VGTAALNAGKGCLGLEILRINVYFHFFKELSKITIICTEKEVSDEKTDILPHVPPDVAGLAGRTL